MTTPPPPLTTRDRVLPALDRARAKLDALGFRAYEVTVRTRTWSGDYVGDGVATDADLVLAPNYRVRDVSAREIAASAGTLRQGDLSIARITPAHAIPRGALQQAVPALVGTAVPVVHADVPAAGLAVARGTHAVVLAIAGGGPAGTATFTWALDGGAASAPTLTPAAGGLAALAGLGVSLDFAASGGVYGVGDAWTFTVATGGYTQAQLRPTTTADNVELLYRLRAVRQGADDDLLCTLVSATFDRALRHALVVRRTVKTP